MKKCVLSILLSIVTSCTWADQFVTVSDVKVRAGKDPNSRVLGQLKKNITIEATLLDSKWYKVSYKGQDGYVQGKYLSGTAAPLVNESSWDDTNTIFIVIGSILAVIGIVFARSTYLSNKNRGRRYVDKNSLPPKVAYWYQCKHCTVFIYNSTEPQLAGCASSTSHQWINLGHVGADQYMCRKCSTIINVAAEPILEGCAGGEEHHWRKF